MGDDRRVHRRGDVRLRAVVRAGAGDRPRRLRRRRRVRRCSRALAGVGAVFGAPARPRAGARRGRCSPACCSCSRGRCRTGLFALGAPLALVIVCAFAHRIRLLAADDLVGDRAGAPHPAARAVARQRVGLDGLAGAAAARLPGRRAAGAVRSAPARCSASAALIGVWCCWPRRAARRASDAASSARQPAQPSSSRARSA